MPPYHGAPESGGTPPSQRQPDCPFMVLFPDIKSKRFPHSLFNRAENLLRTYIYSCTILFHQSIATYPSTARRRPPLFDPATMEQSRLVESSNPVAGVLVLTFNRPEKRNALSKQLIAEFLAELTKASADPTVRVVVITGKGTFFSGMYYCPAQDISASASSKRLM